MGLAPGELWTWVAGLVEFFGGLVLICGVLARYAAAALALELLVAIFALHLPHGFFLPRGFEYALALLGASVTLLLGGAGAWALDPHLRRWWERRRIGGVPRRATA